MKVSVVYASSPYDQFEQVLDVAVGVSVAEVIAMSSLTKQHPDLDIAAASIGIFSQRCDLATVVCAGDRIEVYRPLRLTPMEARRLRAERQAKKHT